MYLIYSPIIGTLTWMVFHCRQSDKERWGRWLRGWPTTGVLPPNTFHLCPRCRAMAWAMAFPLRLLSLCEFFLLLPFLLHVPCFGFLLCDDLHRMVSVLVFQQSKKMHFYEPVFAPNSCYSNRNIAISLGAGIAFALSHVPFIFLF
jgi:hypothetical protein